VLGRLRRFLLLSPLRLTTRPATVGLPRATTASRAHKFALRYLQRNSRGIVGWRHWNSRGRRSRDAGGRLFRGTLGRRPRRTRGQSSIQRLSRGPVSRCLVERRHQNSRARRPRGGRSRSDRTRRTPPADARRPTALVDGRRGPRSCAFRRRCSRRTIRRSLNPNPKAQVFAPVGGDGPPSRRQSPPGRGWRSRGTGRPALPLGRRPALPRYRAAPALLRHWRQQRRRTTQSRCRALRIQRRRLCSVPSEVP